ncbi:SGNH/GDSL hydrolase family protein [Lactiplantibacillus argentoratensis]|uniref:SGNH/GDSL hydrolase family protein n=2 Tax=Lactiplantibacillus argentoratensis TaxID=271881 RepID=UPI003EB9C8EC
MAKTLEFTTKSPRQIKQGDTETTFTFICKNDGSVVDLTKATSITAKIGNASGYLRSQSITINSLAALNQGWLNLQPMPDLISGLPAGGYQLEIWVTDQAGTSIYPSDGSTGFTITNNIQSTNGSTITTITFDDFVNKFNDITANAVKVNENDINATMVDKINLGNILDSYLLVKKSRGYSQPASLSTVDNQSVSVTGVANKATGVLIPFDFKDNIDLSKQLHLIFSYKTSRMGDSANTIGVYVTDTADNLLLKVGTIYQNTQVTKVHLTFNTASLTKISNKGSILFSIGADYELSLTSLMLNYTGFSGSFSEQIIETDAGNIINSPIDLSTYRAAYSVGGETFNLTDDGLIYKRTATSGNGGFGYFCNIDTTKNVYVTYKGGNSANSSFVPRITGADTLGNLKIRLDDNAHTVGNPVTPAGIKTYVYKITPTDFSSAGINKSFGILFTISGNGYAILKDLTVSNTIGFNSNSDTQNKILEKTSLRQNEIIGQSPKSLGSATKINHSGILFGTYDIQSQIDDGILKNLEVFAPSAGNYKFSVGKIDQNDLIVSQTDYQIALNAGYNVIDLEQKQIVIDNGFRLFADLSTLGIYQPDSSHQRLFTSLIQDDSHATTNPNYSGYVMYSDDVLLPFKYEVCEKNVDKKISTLKSSINDTNLSVSNVEAYLGNINLVSPSGKKFGISVDDSGNLTTFSLTANKVLIMGNSLTLAGGQIGMAASNPSSDYYSLVKSKLTAINSNVVVKPRLGAGQWESETTSAGRQQVFDDIISPQLDADTDVVIVQLIDNINTDAKKATFEADAETLIKNIKNKAPKARVFWIARWFADDNLLAELKEACQAAGATQIDITDIARMSDTKSYIGATRTGEDGTSWTVTSSGEAAHPGDKGMQLIADRVIESIT